MKFKASRRRFGSALPRHRHTIFVVLHSDGYLNYPLAEVTGASQYQASLQFISAIAEAGTATGHKGEGSRPVAVFYGRSHQRLRYHPSCDFTWGQGPIASRCRRTLRLLAAEERGRSPLHSLTSKAAHLSKDFRKQIEVFMILNSVPPTSRRWTSIADEVTTEKDPTRLLQLAKELNRAMDEQGVGRPRARTDTADVAKRARAWRILP